VPIIPYSKGPTVSLLGSPKFLRLESVHVTAAEMGARLARDPRKGFAVRDRDLDRRDSDSYANRSPAETRAGNSRATRPPFGSLCKAAHGHPHRAWPAHHRGRIADETISFRASWDQPLKPLRKSPSELDWLFLELEEMERSQNPGTARPWTFLGSEQFRSNSAKFASIARLTGRASCH
jgi:hypothetical protein